MTHTILLQKCERYLAIKSPELNTPTFEMSLRESCHLFAHCHAMMDMQGKQTFWEHILIKLRHWNEQADSLDQVVQLRGDDASEVRTLRDVFEFAMTVFSRNREALSKRNAPHPSDATHAKIAGYFTPETLSTLLDESMLQHAFCYIHSSHQSLRITYHPKSEYWLLYDPCCNHDNFLTVHSFGRKAFIMKSLFESLQSNHLMLEVTSCSPNKSVSFPEYDALLESAPDQLLKEDTLLFIMQHDPHRLLRLLQLAGKESSFQCDYLTRLFILELEKYKQADGYSFLHTMAYTAPDALIELFKLTTHSPFQPRMISAIAESLTIKARDHHWTPLHYILAKAKQALPYLFELLQHPTQGDTLFDAMITALETRIQSHPMVGIDPFICYAPEFLENLINSVFACEEQDKIFNRCLKLITLLQLTIDDHPSVCKMNSQPSFGLFKPDTSYHPVYLNLLGDLKTRLNRLAEHVPHKQHL